MNHRELQFSLLLVLFWCSAAMADQITLKNGDRITGTIMKSDGKTLVFSSALVGDLSIALDNVQQIISDKPLYIELADGRTVVGTVNGYRVNFDTSLAMDITKRIAWQLTLSDRYLSDPPSGFKQNDLILTTGLRVKLGTPK